MKKDFNEITNAAHYNTGGVDAFYLIEAKLGKLGLSDFCYANAIKYIWRCGKKGERIDQIKDLKKAAFYLEKCAALMGEVYNITEEQKE